MDTKTNKPLTFSKSQFDLINSIIDCLIPSNSKMPSASQMQVAQYIDSFTNNSPTFIRLMLEGLQELEKTSHEVSSKAFIDLDTDSKYKILQIIEVQNPVFFLELIRQTYNGYYTTPQVLRLIGTEGRPPQPLGYELEEGNLDLLKKVKDRGQIWREI